MSCHSLSVTLCFPFAKEAYADACLNEANSMTHIFLSFGEIVGPQTVHCHAELFRYLTVDKVAQETLVVISPDDLCCHAMNNDSKLLS